MSEVASSKRIAKNTLFLYIRSFFVIIVSLYTSRVILDVLGVEDYGVYNTVAGVVSMFSVLTSSLSGAISRFFTVALGKGDSGKLQSVFKTSLSLQIVMSGIIILVASSVGGWFVATQLNLPEYRSSAAQWVLQCAIVTFVINLLSVPYNAAIIAHERMKAFAYVSIFDTLLKLLVVYLLYTSPNDKLVSYAILLVVEGLIVQSIYWFYCTHNFVECRQYKWIIDKKLVKEMAGYAGWNMMGNTAYILNTQGVNILINLFFGVTFNAARGVAVQIQSAVMKFVIDFSTALNPQIIKSYAAGDTDFMYKLVCRGVKYIIFLSLFFLIPLLLEADTMLRIWLKEVPPQSAIFCRLLIIGAVIDSCGLPLTNSIMANGRIRNYQIAVSIVGVMVCVFTWIAYKLGAPAYSTCVIYIVVYLMVNAVRVIYSKKTTGLSVRTFTHYTIFPAVSVLAISVIIPLIFTHYVDASFVRLISTSFISFVCTLITIYIVGIDKSERATVHNKFALLLNRLKR